MHETCQLLIYTFYFWCTISWKVTVTMVLFLHASWPVWNLSPSWVTGVTCCCLFFLCSLMSFSKAPFLSFCQQPQLHHKTYWNKFFLVTTTPNLNVNPFNLPWHGAFTENIQTIFLLFAVLLLRLPSSTIFLPLIPTLT